MLQILNAVIGVGCIVCFIIVLVKLFQENGVLHGILGLICGLYTFIWGWINATRLNIRNIMMIWTLLIVVSIILTVLGGGFSYSMGTPVR